MDTLSLREIPADRSERQHHAPSPALRPPLSESAFAAQLVLERRRAERSGRQIGLLLLDTGAIFPEEGTEQERAALIELLCRCLRTTDVVGWHIEGAVAGVILTEFGDSAVPTALPPIRKRILEQLHLCNPAVASGEAKITFREFPGPWEKLQDVSGLDLAFYPELMGPLAAHGGKQALKRAVDLLGSLALLLFFSPALVLIALLVRLSSRGPALYRQERIGQFGVPFTMLKFRSMHWDADAQLHETYVKQFIGGQAQARETGGLYKLQADPRITALGHFLRKTSLDELPQLFNVLRGEMSLVGPRPPLRYEIEAYRGWHRRRVLEAKPGLTGLWQVTGRSRTRFDEMVRLDLRYAARQSLWLDLLLLVKTVRVLLFDAGAR